MTGVCRDVFNLADYVVIDSDRMISTNIKLPVISLSVVKPRSGRKLKTFLKLILANFFLAYNRSNCSNLFQSIVLNLTKFYFVHSYV